MLSKSNAANSAIIGIYTLLLGICVIIGLYVGQTILIPVALAVLLSFLLSQFITPLEKKIGRYASVFLVVFVVFIGTCIAGYILTRQVIDLVPKLPEYKENLQTKLRSIHIPKGGVLTHVSNTIEELKNEIPGVEPSPQPSNNLSPQEGGATSVVPVKIVETNPDWISAFETFFGKFFTILGTAGFIFLLVIVMLINREDLRGRIIRLIGEGRISSTSRLMDDASTRISRYLFMQLIVNIIYGVPVAIGLYLLGIPNAILWGGLGLALRFIPYVGAWIAAAVPIALSFAVSTGWTIPILTISLYIGLELVIANVVEPLVYGSSTGVSPVALIVAAVFWTWLWGPIGLVLSTPLTVCLVVIGQHIPRLEFLSVLLSDVQALTPDQEFYHRLLVSEQNEALSLVENYLKTHSLVEVYDNVLIPVIIAGESDLQAGLIDADQGAALHQNIHEIIDDLNERPSPVAPAKTEEQVEPQAPMILCHVACVPARSERDELAGEMLTQLLKQKSCEAFNISVKLSIAELIDSLQKQISDVIFISVVPPSTIIHARYISSKIRNKIPYSKIIVGMWGSTEISPDTILKLRSYGVDEIVTTLAEALNQLEKLSSGFAEEMKAASLPFDEEARLAVLKDLSLLNSEANPRFDRMIAKIARIFDVPIALISVIDAERQVILSNKGLPEDLAKAGYLSRSSSIDTYVIASNKIFIVENLARDPRFANHSFYKEKHLYFYAGAPLRAQNGQPIGVLSLLDTKPRKFNERDKNLLQLYAEEVMEEMVMITTKPPPQNQPPPEATT